MILREGRFWRVAILLIAAHALQTTWLAPLHLGAASLDLPFLVALSCALWGGVARGALAGAGAGYLDGLATLFHPGSSLISRLVPCVLAGAGARHLKITNPLVPPFIAALACALADGIYLLFSPGDWTPDYWLAHTPASMMLHALAIWPVFWLVGRLVKPRKELMFG